jgi:hypothetical protein
MKIFTRNRYGHETWFESRRGNKWKVSCTKAHYCRLGGEPDNIIYWDPEGGPFIEKGVSLNRFHKDLPDSLITSIKPLKTGGIIVSTEP